MTRDISLSAMFVFLSALSTGGLISSCDSSRKSGPLASEMKCLGTGFVHGDGQGAADSAAAENRHRHVVPLDAHAVAA